MQRCRDESEGVTETSLRLGQRHCTTENTHRQKRRLYFTLLSDVRMVRSVLDSAIHVVVVKCGVSEE